MTLEEAAQAYVAAEAEVQQAKTAHSVAIAAVELANEILNEAMATLDCARDSLLVLRVASEVEHA